MTQGLAGIALFIFQQGSRNAFNNKRQEAKLITPNGFAISLASEWIANPVGESEKQDCERRAFARLAVTLKRETVN